MFGKVPEYQLPVMSFYKAPVISDIKNALSSDMRRVKFTKVNITKFPYIILDLIGMNMKHISYTEYVNKNKKLMELMKGGTKKERLSALPEYRPVEVSYSLQVGANTEYFKSWRKGIGRFIDNEIRTGKDNDRYFVISYYNRDNEFMNAFVRIVTDDDIKTEEDEADMSKYHAIAVEYTQTQAPAFDDMLMLPHYYVNILKIWKGKSKLSDVIGKVMPIDNDDSETDGKNIITVDVADIQSNATEETKFSEEALF